MADHDIVVIGGGLIGCATAYYLARSGAQVLLLERGQVNQGASGRNAGSLHFQLEHRLIQNIELDVRELEFYVALAKIAIDHCRGLESELGCDLQVGMNGGLMVAETPDQVSLLKRKAEVETRQGLDVELLDGDAARRLAPYLSSNILAALHCPHEGHSNPRLLTPAYARKATEQGVQLLTGAQVTGINRERAGGKHWRIEYRDQQQPDRSQEIRCHAVLNAAGAWAREVGALANLHLPLFPVGLTMNATEKVAPCVPHLIQHVGRRLSLKQTDDGNLLIGGGWSARLGQQHGHWAETAAPEILLDSVQGNLRAATEVVPMVRSLRLLRTWTGTTAITADHLPVLGEVPEAPGFFVAAGGSGYTYGPTYARMMSELMLTGNSSFSLQPFSPARFGGLNAFMGQAG